MRRPPLAGLPSMLLLATLLAASSIAFHALAQKPERPPAGMGKYILFLKLLPPVPPGQTQRRIVPPDVTKLGGRLLKATSEYRVIYLPFEAVKQLRRDENVDYVQRVWVGETPEEWQTTESLDAPSRSGLTSDSLTETASWGPKNYTYDGAGNIKQIAEIDAGGIPKLIGTDTYTYDAVSRITTAVVNGITQTYGYDAFGNMTATRTGTAATSFRVDGSSNRLSDRTYDLAGNVTGEGGRSYWYDSMGMLAGMTSPNGPKRMFYTASDERIGFSIGNQGNFSRWMIRDFEGRPLREFRSQYFLENFQDAEWIWTEDYVYANGQLVAGETAGPYGIDESTIQQDRRRRHYHLDHLGSVRLITTDTGAVALGVQNYYPFGAEQTQINQEEYNFGGSGVIRPTPLRFTGHERDFNGSWSRENSDYIDYMHARYYSPFTGRFLSPDPVLDVKKSAAQPQRWNRYAYVSNNPVNNIDPNGREQIEAQIRAAAITYLIWGQLDPKIHFNFGGRSWNKMTGTGVKGADYFGIDLTDTFNRGSKNAIDITAQAKGLGIEAVLSFDGSIPSVDELYVLGGPFAKSLFKTVEDKFTTAIAMGGGISLDQKLDSILPQLIEYMAMPTSELLVEVTNKAEKEGYRMVQGQLVRVVQKK